MLDPSPETFAEVGIHLPACLTGLVRGYFQSSVRAPVEIAEAGEYEACMLSPHKGACLEGAIQGNHVEIARCAVGGYFSNANYGLTRACMHGSLAIVELMISLGADDWDNGLAQACFGSKQLCIDLMIARGAKVCYSCRGPH